MDNIVYLRDAYANVNPIKTKKIITPSDTPILQIHFGSVMDEMTLFPTNGFFEFIETAINNYRIYIFHPQLEGIDNVCDIMFKWFCQNRSTWRDNELVYSPQPQWVMRAIKPVGRKEFAIGFIDYELPFCKILNLNNCRLVNDWPDLIEHRKDNVMFNRAMFNLL